LPINRIGREGRARRHVSGAPTTMNNTSHTDTSFDADIGGMRRAILSMGRLAAEQFRRAVVSVGSGDAGLVAEILATERRVNRLHVEIDGLCAEIIAKRQPIAVDLREVIGTIHIAADLERIGDEAKKIAKKGRSIQGDSLQDVVSSMRGMADRAADMFDRALDALTRHDVSVAAGLAASDDEVDTLRETLTSTLVARMGSEPGCIESALNLVMIVRSIERVADHAESIGEIIVNVSEGVDLRHKSLLAATR
jgi:phosphate transport system protein